MFVLALLFLQALLGLPAASQLRIVDDFGDGDFDRDPAWIGDTARFSITYLGDDPALSSNGTAASDTLALAVPHAAAYGTWGFFFAHRDVNLSTFNGARVFICAREPDVRRTPTGYYVQFGTNNTDAVSLWRVDGTWSKRIRLGRSEDARVAGDSSRVNLTVRRYLDGRWDVDVNGTTAFTAEDGVHTECAFMAVWIKHTPAGRSSFVFDRFVSSPVVAPEPPPPRSPPQHGDVVLNEIQFAPPPTGSEFIELYNRSGRSVALDVLTLRDATASPSQLADAQIDLPPGAYAVLVQDADAFSDQFRTVPFLAVSPWPSLNNAGDRVVLEAAGVVIDSMSYTAEAGRAGRSLERIDPDAPSDTFNFAPSDDPFGATPGRRNTRYAPDRRGPELRYAMQVNRRALDLFFDEPIRRDALSPEAVKVGTARGLSTASTSANHLRVEIDHDYSGRSVTVAGATDLRGNTSTSTSAPVSYRPLQLDVVINEIMYEPSADERDGVPDQTEYIEVLNRSTRRVFLDGLFRTREPNERGDADTTWMPATHVALDPGKIRVLANPPLPVGLEALPIGSLSLRNDGDVIRLHNDLGDVLDEVRYEPSWHHPDLLERRGVSLERIASNVSSNDPSNWSSSVDPHGGTPGAPNSVNVSARAPTGTARLAAEPNPFSPDRDGHEDAVQFTYVSPGRHSVRVRVRLFDLTGLVVRHLAPAQLVSGSASYIWDGRDDDGRHLRSGIYIAVVEAIDASNGSTEKTLRPVVLARP
ncbi:MAG: lamin tail domain-containing protein [Rhodothermales bacterium]